MHISTLTLAAALFTLFPSILSAPININARTPAPVAEPGTIGSACFGSSATGCKLSKTHSPSEDDIIGPLYKARSSEDDDIIIRAREPEPVAGTIGSACFGSSATGCKLTKTRSEEEASLEAEVVARAPEPGTIGSACFGSSATGCKLTKNEVALEAEIAVRTPEPVAEAEPGTIGSACFGSSATGCKLTKSRSEEAVEREEIVARTPEPVAEPGTIGSACFGSSATGCKLY